MASTLSNADNHAECTCAVEREAAPPRVVVWEADGSPYGDIRYSHELATRLASRGIPVSIVPLARRAPSAVELHAPVHLVSGGRSPVWSHQPWILRARQVMEKIVDRALDGKAHVTGICFGSQLIASVLAGPHAVRANPYGIEAGLSTVTCMDGSETYVVSEFHYEEIDAKSIENVGGKITLTNDHTHVQAFTVGSNITGFQFHPELEPTATWRTLWSHRKLIRNRSHAPASAPRSVCSLGSLWDAGTFDRLVIEPFAPPSALAGGVSSRG